jgi:hypothetical protein
MVICEWMRALMKATINRDYTGVFHSYDFTLSDAI